MANETVPSPTMQRVSSLVNDAMHEVELLAQAMQRHIEETDEIGNIHPVSRGILLRIRQLAEATALAVGSDDAELESSYQAIEHGREI